MSKKSNKSKLADAQSIPAEVEHLLGITMESEPNSRRLRWWGVGVLVVF